MPSRSPAQHRLMEAAAHSKGTSEKTGVPQAVAKEFVHADEQVERKRGEREAGGKVPHGYGR